MTGNNKLQAPNFKQIPNLKLQILNKTKRRLFGILNLGHCDLPFDLAQSGDLDEPFSISDLLFDIF